MSDTTQTQENTQETPEKVRKQFESAVGNLVKILGVSDESKLIPSKKVKKDELTAIVDELLKEEREKNQKEVSEGLKGLLKGYADLKAEVKKKQEELQKLEKERMKEFTKAAQNLFSRIEVMNAKAQEFKAGLAEASSGSPAQ